MGYVKQDTWHVSKRIFWYMYLYHALLKSPPLLEQCVTEHASAMGLKVKGLTNSQFELREES
ncbi:unnamed protein product [Porites lobata]|uniref:Uncharacterized protein n=1 Tax=Porites lobata TaxID=104759 RepID=A0ABN8N2H5_9CNID|nr:unnamed protein product [Porites lobata]